MDRGIRPAESELAEVAEAAEAGWRMEAEDERPCCCARLCFGKARARGPAADEGETIPLFLCHFAWQKREGRPITAAATTFQLSSSQHHPPDSSVGVCNFLREVDAQCLLCFCFCLCVWCDSISSNCLLLVRREILIEKFVHPVSVAAVRDDTAAPTRKHSSVTAACRCCTSGPSPLLRTCRAHEFDWECCPDGARRECCLAHDSRSLCVYREGHHVATLFLEVSNSSLVGGEVELQFEASPRQLE